MLQHINRKACEGRKEKTSENENPGCDSGTYEASGFGCFSFFAFFATFAVKSFRGARDVPVRGQEAKHAVPRSDASIYRMLSDYQIREYWSHKPEGLRDEKTARPDYLFNFDLTVSEWLPQFAVGRWQKD